jgi:transcriptional regulator with XRE-family HTH domain
VVDVSGDAASIPTAHLLSTTNPSAFRHLLKAHRERIGISMNQLAKAIPMDQSTLSKIEKGRRPPPAVIPYVHRIAELLGLAPNSSKRKQLVNAAQKERGGLKQGSRPILVLAPGPDGGPPVLYHLGINSPGFSGLPASPERIQAIEEINPDSPLGRHFNRGPRLETIQLPDNLAQMLDKLGLGGIQGMINSTGVRITEFTQQEESFNFGFNVELPNGKRYRLQIDLTYMP